MRVLKKVKEMVLRFAKVRLGLFAGQVEASSLSNVRLDRCRLRVWASAVLLTVFLQVAPSECEGIFESVERITQYWALSRTPINIPQKVKSSRNICEDLRKNAADIGYTEMTLTARQFFGLWSSKNVVPHTSISSQINTFASVGSPEHGLGSSVLTMSGTYSQEPELKKYEREELEWHLMQENTPINKIRSGYLRDTKMQGGFGGFMVTGQPWQLPPGLTGRRG